MCSIAFENEPAEPDLMQQPPRPLAEPLIGAQQLLLGLAQGVMVLLACLGIFGWAIGQHAGDAATARSVAFLTLTAGNLALVRSNASRVQGWRALFGRQRHSFWLIAGAASLAVSACFAVPAARALFGFAVIGYPVAAAAIAVGFLSGSGLELLKWHPAVRRILGQSQRATKATAAPGPG